VFKLDPDYVENEKKYEAIKKKLLGDDSSDDEDGGEKGSGDSEKDSDAESSSEEEEEVDTSAPILDQTETNMIALRRTIYLTIQSSLDFEETVHKLMKLNLKPGHEMELCHMVIGECPF
jgi:pre-mRNA-splicing factor CWC22